MLKNNKDKKTMLFSRVNRLIKQGHKKVTKYLGRSDTEISKEFSEAKNYEFDEFTDEDINFITEEAKDSLTEEFSVFGDLPKRGKKIKTEPDLNSESILNFKKTEASSTEITEEGELKKTIDFSITFPEKPKGNNLENKENSKVKSTVPRLNNEKTVLRRTFKPNQFVESGRVDNIIDSPLVIYNISPKTTPSIGIPSKESSRLERQKRVLSLNDKKISGQTAKPSFIDKKNDTDQKIQFSPTISYKPSKRATTDDAQLGSKKPALKGKEKASSLSDEKVSIQKTLPGYIDERNDTDQKSQVSPTISYKPSKKTTTDDARAGSKKPALKGREKTSSLSDEKVSDQKTMPSFTDEENDTDQKGQVTPTIVYKPSKKSAMDDGHDSNEKPQLEATANSFKNISKPTVVLEENSLLAFEYEDLINTSDPEFDGLDEVDEFYDDYLEEQDETLFLSAGSLEEDWEPDDLEWEVLEELEDFDEFASRETEQLATGSITREQRARQIALEVLDQVGWELDELTLLETIFIENGWGAARVAIVSLINTGVTPEELALARQIRFVWFDNECFWTTFRMRSSAPYMQAESVYKNFSWVDAVRVIQGFSNTPDIEEIQLLFDEMYEDWYSSGRLRRVYKAFYKYFKYRIGAVQRTLPGDVIFSFADPVEEDLGVDDLELQNPSSEIREQLFEFGITAGEGGVRLPFSESEEIG